MTEVLQDGFNEDDFTLTSKDMNGGISVSPDSKKKKKNIG